MPLSYVIDYPTVSKRGSVLEIYKEKSPKRIQSEGSREGVTNFPRYLWGKFQVPSICSSDWGHGSQEGPGARGTGPSEIQQEHAQGCIFQVPEKEAQGKGEREVWTGAAGPVPDHRTCWILTYSSVVIMDQFFGVSGSGTWHANVLKLCPWGPRFPRGCWRPDNDATAQAPLS